MHAGSEGITLGICPQTADEALYQLPEGSAGFFTGSQVTAFQETRGAQGASRISRGTAWHSCPLISTLSFTLSSRALHCGSHTYT